MAAIVIDGGELAPASRADIGRASSGGGPAMETRIEAAAAAAAAVKAAAVSVAVAGDDGPPVGRRQRRRSTGDLTEGTGLQPGQLFRLLQSAAMAGEDSADEELDDSSDEEEHALMEELKQRMEEAEEEGEDEVALSFDELNSLLSELQVLRQAQRSKDATIRSAFSARPELFDDGLQDYILSNFTREGVFSKRISTAERYRRMSQSLSKVAVLGGRRPSIESASIIVAASGGSGGSGGGGSGSGGSVAVGAARRRTVSVGRPVLELLPVEEDVSEAMSKLDSWQFNIFDVADRSRTPFVSIGFALLEKWNAVAVLSCGARALRTLLASMSAAYVDNPYHNALHGADVAQTLHYFFYTGKLARHYDDRTVAASLLAALIHDVGHVGVNNAFLVATSDALALRYNDRSPLENMHCSVLFEAMKLPECSIFSRLAKETRQQLRGMIIDMVLATDNARHSEYLLTLNSRKADGSFSWESGKDKLLMLQIALHAADVSNPAKPWDTYITWTNRIITEFYAQGDRERELGLPVTAIMDREKPIPLENFQAGFIGAIVMPLFRSFADTDGLQLAEPLGSLENNLAEWDRRRRETPSKELLAARGTPVDDDHAADAGHDGDDIVVEEEEGDEGDDDAAAAAGSGGASEPASPPRPAGFAPPAGLARPRASRE
eukprot:PLAT6305.2.p1 GENE.PLAT6305.2~~PLAT6305.2.p1  ORF type:complete len:665 (+),score=360.34 PLAT6305.2:95-2089(+)